jgi:hypothetical protein
LIFFATNQVLARHSSGFLSWRKHNYKEVFGRDVPHFPSNLYEKERLEKGRVPFVSWEGEPEKASPGFLCL